MRHTLTYGQLLTVERELNTNLTLTLLMGPKVNKLLQDTLPRRAAVNSRYDRIKEKYIQTDASGNLLTVNQNGLKDWLFLDLVTIDGITHAGSEEVKKAFYRETEKFLNDNSITIDL